MSTKLPKLSINHEWIIIVILSRKARTKIFVSVFTIVSFRNLSMDYAEKQLRFMRKKQPKAALAVSFRIKKIK